MSIGAVLGQIREEEQDFFQLLEALYDRRFTGTIVLQCRNGKPYLVEFPHTQIRLTSDSISPTLVPDRSNRR